MPTLDDDVALRQAAFSRVLALQRRYANEIPWEAIAEGFELRGATHPLASKAEGIYKPRGHPFALSLKTPVPRRGRQARYADSLDASGGLFRYGYKSIGGKVDNAANASLDAALAARLPLIYFVGLSPGVYHALVPVFAVAKDDARQEFLLAPGAVLENDEPTHVHEVISSAPEKRYLARTVLQRVHQRSFRVNVISAYDHHCAMCSIHFDEFLEAAHIVPDADPLGVPEVQNGLALCGLHHRAFDRFLVDVDDDYRVVLSPELRRRRDGPIFKQAFLDRNHERLNLPARPELHPSLHHLQARRASRPPELWAG